MKNFKLKLNKKILFASIAGIFGATGIAAVAAACNDKGSNNQNSNTNNNSNDQQTSGSKDNSNTNATSSSLSVNNFFSKSKDSEISSYQSTYNNLIDDGARHLGLIGYTNAKPLKVALENSDVLNNDKTTFSLVDNKYYGSSGGERVASVTFRTDQAGFLAGVAAAYYLNSNQNHFAKDGTLKWGGFVGEAYSSTLSFIQGFNVGVMWANLKLSSKDIMQDSSSTSEKKKWINVKLATVNAGLTSGDFNPDNKKVDEITNQLITAKANLILPVAGPQTIKVVQITSASEQPAVVIGVDSPQEQTDNKKRVSNTEINNGQTILFSIIKRVDLAIEQTTKMAKDGSALERKEGDFYPDSYKLGTHTTADLNEKTKVNGQYLVGVSDPAHTYLLKAVKLANENSSATDYLSAVKELAEQEEFKLLSLDKSSTWDNYLEPKKDKKEKWRQIKSSVTQKDLDLQKLLGGNAFVYGDKVYSYDFENSSYLTTGNGSTEFKKIWDENKNNSSELEKLVKIVLGNPSSVLRDGSFSQSAYEGLLEFYKENGIKIPSL